MAVSSFVRLLAPTACRRGAVSVRSPPSPAGAGRSRSLLRVGVAAPHGCRGERGACRRHVAVRDRAEGAQLSALRGGSSTSPTAEGGNRGSSDAFREEDEQCSSAAIGVGFSAHRARAAPRGLLRGDRA